MVLAGGACGCSRTRVIADLVAPASRQLPCRALDSRAVQAGHDAAATGGGATISGARDPARERGLVGAAAEAGYVRRPRHHHRRYSRRGCTVVAMCVATAPSSPAVGAPLSMIDRAWWYSTVITLGILQPLAGAWEGPEIVTQLVTTAAAPARLSATTPGCRNALTRIKQTWPDFLGQNAVHGVQTVDRQEAAPGRITRVGDGENSGSQNSTDVDRLLHRA
jgi:hypothetical protein